jgi:hypothetical protein
VAARGRGRLDGCTGHGWWAVRPRGTRSFTRRGLATLDESGSPCVPESEPRRPRRARLRPDRRVGGYAVCVLCCQLGFELESRRVLDAVSESLRRVTCTTSRARLRGSLRHQPPQGWLFRFVAGHLALIGGLRWALLSRLSGVCWASGFRSGSVIMLPSRCISSGARRATRATGAEVPAVLRRHERQHTSAHELITTRELVDVESGACVGSRARNNP